MTSTVAAGVAIGIDACPATGDVAHSPSACCAGELCRLLAGGGPEDRRRLVGAREQAGVLDDVEVAFMVDGVAGPQRAHDLDRLDEHVLADVGGWPAIAGDVLVQRFAGADAEEEASAAELAPTSPLPGR